MCKISVLNAFAISGLCGIVGDNVGVAAVGFPAAPSNPSDAGVCSRMGEGFASVSGKGSGRANCVAFVLSPTVCTGVFLP